MASNAAACTQRDSDVLSFRIYVSWFRRHLVGKTVINIC